MNNKFLTAFSRVSIAFLFIMGICICLWWYPFSISLCTTGLVSGESAASVPVSQSQAVSFWTQLIFAWLTSLPCFFVLILGYKTTINAANNEFFSKKNADIFKTVFILLLTDSVVLIIGNTIFMVLEWNPFALFYYIAGAVGIIFAFASFFAHRYLIIATKIKEENDSIL